jgi:RNA polymerase sigma-70 factor (ECF subfamily)
MVPRVPPPVSEQPPPDPVGERLPGPSFNALYAQHFEFVWRVVRRLGVRDGAIDDVVQDIFVIVHRRLPSFEGRSLLKTWLFGITRRVVKDHLRRRPEQVVHEPLAEELVGGTEDGPFDVASRSEASRLLHRLLDELDETRREVFVLAELEQMTAPEIAEALGLNLNTVYSRIRAARQAFERAVARHQARKQGGSP